MSPSKLLPLEREIELIRRHRAGDAGARAQLVACNQGVVHAVARPYRHKHALDDLVQEGNMGLLRAIDMFDPTRGVRFGSYATNWVRAFIWRFMKYQLQVRTQRHESSELSLEAPSGDDELALIDRLEAPEQRPDVAAIDGDLGRKVNAALGRLKTRLTGLPWDIVQRRLLHDDATLEDLGLRHGVSRERVRQVEMRTRALLARQMAPFREVLSS